jgi:hypothetical protein
MTEFRIPTEPVDVLPVVIVDPDGNLVSPETLQLQQAMLRLQLIQVGPAAPVDEDGPS